MIPVGITGEFYLGLALGLIGFMMVGQMILSGPARRARDWANRWEHRKN